MARIGRFKPLLLLCVSTFLGTPLLAAAQDGITVRLSPPLTDSFPAVTLFVSVADVAGRRVSGQTAQNFQVLEDGVPASGLEVEESVVGTRQVYVINTNQGLKLRDASGRSRFDHIREALLLCWQLPEASMLGVDDWTLITADGALSVHRPSVAELASVLDYLEPTFEGGTTDFDLLLQALDFLSDPAPRQGMHNYLIFMTPTIQAEREAPLVNAIARANETSTTIFTVLVGPPETVDLPETSALRQIAEATGGSFTLLDETQGLTGLAERLIEQRTQYQVTYTSGVNSSGAHAVQVKLKNNEAEVVSDPRNFEIDVLPPEVAFIDPPVEIVRRSEDSGQAIEDIPPTTNTLRLLVTFPDGHPREVTSSQLLVDGQVVLHRVQSPFDTLEWDLTGYRESGPHVLSALVEDSLGLQGTTVDTPVLVQVILPQRGLAALRSALGPMTTALAILIAGIVLAIGLVSIGRTRGATQRATKPVRSYRRSRLQRASLGHATSGVVEAFLFPVTTPHQEGEPIPLTGTDLILGQNASLAAVVLDDPSVAGLHARLIRQAGGDYLLRDQGSVAGTWVNYVPVPPQGRRLKHGDLIHLGRVAFRFRLASPPPSPRVRITPDSSQQVFAGVTRKVGKPARPAATSTSETEERETPS